MHVKQTYYLLTPDPVSPKILKVGDLVSVHLNGPDYVVIESSSIPEAVSFKNGNIIEVFKHCYIWERIYTTL